VVAGIVVEEDRVLISQRPHSQSFAHKWEFPGGKVEEGESVEEALDREFREELGVGVVSVREYGVIRYRDPGGRDLEVLFLLARRTAGNPMPLQVEAVSWMPAEKLLEVDFIPANREIVERLIVDVREGNL
jgi:mutator protein MutT